MQLQLTVVTLKVHGCRDREHFIATAHPDSLKHWKKKPFQRFLWGSKGLCWDCYEDFFFWHVNVPTKIPPCNCMHMSQIRSNLGLMSSVAESTWACAVFKSTAAWRKGGIFPAICNGYDTTKARGKSDRKETTSFLSGSSRSRWNSIFLPPAFLFYMPRGTEQIWTRLWWKGNSNRAKPYSFTHRQHPLLGPGPVQRKSGLRQSSGGFFLLLLFLLLICFSSLARPLSLTGKDLRRRLT